MAAIERRPLKKAPQVSVIDALTGDQAPVAPQPPAPAVAKPAAKPPLQKQVAAKEGPDESVGGVAPVRRSPGRPRSARRMEQLATKIDIELRDRVDAYLAANGGTLVDLIDEALRARISK